MELRYIQKPILSMFKGISVLILAVAIIMGWLILLLAALSTLSDFVPILSGAIDSGRAFVLGTFIFMLQNPLGDTVVLLVGGYLIQHRGWADWL
jgi:hypothetical protein